MKQRAAGPMGAAAAGSIPTPLDKVVAFVQ